MFTKELFWRVFESTGRITAYLDYKRSENKQKQDVKKEELCGVK